jgi:hypothetical protein
LKTFCKSDSATLHRCDLILSTPLFTCFVTDVLIPGLHLPLCRGAQTVRCVLSYAANFVSDFHMKMKHKIYRRCHSNNLKTFLSHKRWSLWPEFKCLRRLTPWSRGLLEKLTVSQLVKKFPAFYGTRKFITAFTITRNLSLS